VVRFVGLLRDPKRAAVVGCAIWMIVSVVLAWASAQATRGIVTYQPITSGDAEPVLITVFSLLLIAWAASDGAASSSSRTVQLAGPGLAIALTSIALSVESKARVAVHEWISVGWSASAETSIAPFTMAVGIAAIGLTIWIDARRPDSVRDRTGSFFSEWEITWGNVARSTISVVGAVAGAAIGLSLGVFLTNGWGYAALLYILLAAMGMFVGAKLGTAVGRRIVNVRLPHLFPVRSTALAAAPNQAIGSIPADDTVRPLGNDIWMAPGAPRTPPPDDSASSMDDAWHRPSAGAALSEDGATAPMVEGSDPAMWRRPDEAR
jgi:hypothetical protein